MKLKEVGTVVKILNKLFVDQRLKPDKKLSMIRFMRELNTQLDDIAAINTGIYTKYALKDKDGKMIKHPFDTKYAYQEIFKDNTKQIILIPISNRNDNYVIELQYTTYKTVHQEAIEFLDKGWTPVSKFSLLTEEAVNYNLSASEIEELMNLGIVKDLKEVIN